MINDGPIYLTYIFTILTYTSTIITLKPYALNAKIHHFILKFNQKNLFCEYLEKKDKSSNLAIIYL
jgi:hypothetical protein